MSAFSDWLDRVYTNRIYQRLSGPLVIVTLLLSLLGVAGAYVNNRADSTRTQQTFQCIDERDTYAAESSQTLRDATQVRDDLSQERGRATIAKERALVEWTDLLIEALANQSGEEASPAMVAKFARVTADLNAAARDLQDTERALRNANRELKKARRENPVVPPASEVCASGTFVPPEPVKS